MLIHHPPPVVERGGGADAGDVGWTEMEAHQLGRNVSFSATDDIIDKLWAAPGVASHLLFDDWLLNGAERKGRRWFPLGLPAACKSDPFSTLCVLSCQVEHLLRVSQPRPKLLMCSCCHANERLALLSSLAKGSRAATVLLERSGPPFLLLRSGLRPRQ